MRISAKPWWRTPVINHRDWQWQDANAKTQSGGWWQNAIIYQIAPWDFLDTTGDGKGDLHGIVQKLDYIASLGVDAIWLTPIYESPMDDFGYDITDMQSIGSEFGNIEDFLCLLDVAHSTKLKIIVDQVWNHTSNQHPWFLESRQNRTNPKSDWYVWADPKADGTPPNNWLSSFTGDCAWKWEPKRQQYYLHNFLETQPDLNWHNDDVVAAILKRAKFWLDLGVDGLRIDAVNFFLHDPQLRDNPPRPKDALPPDGIPSNHPMARQLLVHSFNQPDVYDRIRPIRQLVDQYPDVVTLGEVTLCEDSIALSSEYTDGDCGLHLAYHSGLLCELPMTASLMGDILSRVSNYFGDGGTCWIVGNHDYGRLRSRWTGKDSSGNPYPDDFYRMIAALLLSLPGAFCLWQGDELGLPIADIPEDIPPEEIKDPFGKAMYPVVVGRDGSRTPMPWTSEMPCGGFTTAEKPWLPIAVHHLDRSVQCQHTDKRSLLNTWRRLLHWRRNQPALEAGRLDFLDVSDSILAFSRIYLAHRLLCVFNISAMPASYDLSNFQSCDVVGNLEFDCDIEGSKVTLPPYGVFFGQLSCP